MQETTVSGRQIQDPAGFLRTIHPFDRLPREAFDRAAREIEIVYHEKGTRLLIEGGQPSPGVYVIRKGTVLLQRQRETVMTLEEGDLFGYPSMFSGMASFDAVVDEDLLAYLLPEKGFRDLLSESAFAGFFTVALADRLRNSMVERLEPAFAVDFHLPVERLIERPAASLPASASVRDAAVMMSRERVSSILVEGEPWGIVTDRDLRNRILALGRDASTPLSEIASTPLRTVPADTPVYGAWMAMLENRINHLPIVREGRVIGVVTDTDLLRHQTGGPLFALKRVENLPDRGALSGYAREVARMSDVLHGSGLETTQIARLVSRISDTLVRRILQWAHADLGEPPQPYAWIVFGSEGRHEQTLLTDQDNALIYAGDDPEARAYFSGLAERVVSDLLAAGYPRCAGGYMATKWNGPLEEWRDRFENWIVTPQQQALLQAAIFFDYRPVAGELDLSPISDVLQTAPTHAPFLAHLARSALDFRPPLTFLRQVRTEEGGVDLKRGGLMPVAGLARSYGLKARALVTNTIDRLSAAVSAGFLAADEAETLQEAYRFLLDLRLKSQLQSLGRGSQPSNRVSLDTLSAMERSHLKEVFRAVETAQKAAAWHFHTSEL